MKNPWIVIAAVTVVLIGGSVVYSNKVAEKNNEGITFSSHLRGNENAEVTLTEYSDFQCPACASFQPVLEEMMAEFGDSIKIEYKHFPLPIHVKAESAARAAEAAGQQGAFFEFHDLLFANQSAWVNAPNSLLLFTKYAEEIGLDVDKFRKHYGASLIRDRVREDLQEARSLNLTSTPSFFLNGEKMEFNTFESFQAQISAALGIEEVGATAEEPKVQFGI